MTNNNNDNDNNYLDDLSITKELDPDYLLSDGDGKFCTSCGHQAFPSGVSDRQRDIYRCSNCFRVFTIAEKENLTEKEKIKPVRINQTAYNNIFNSSADVATALDPYEELEKEKQITAFKEKIQSTFGATMEENKPKRKLDKDDLILKNKGYTLLDIE